MDTWQSRVARGVPLRNFNAATAASADATMGGCVSSYVARVAFDPQPPCYSADDVGIWLTTDRGNVIPAFHIHRGHAVTVLVSHTNAEDLGKVYEYWALLSERLGVNVFGFEYSGYGHATGLPSERNVYSDARAALARVMETHGLVPERDIVLYGKSIGSCAACYLASRHTFRGIILVSPLASGARLVSSGNLTAKLADAATVVASPFDNLSKLAKSAAPVQLLHGTEDEAIPVRHAKALFDRCAARGLHPLPPAWIEGATHNGIETQFADAHFQCVTAFLRLLKERGGEAARAPAPAAVVVLRPEAVEVLGQEAVELEVSDGSLNGSSGRGDQGEISGGDQRTVTALRVEVRT